jgi:hypothetical protein
MTNKTSFAYRHYYTQEDGELTFYVGAGSKRRAFNFKKREPLWFEVVAKFGEPTVELFGPVSDSDAFFMEGALIDSFGRLGMDDGGTLVNWQPGVKDPDRAASRLITRRAKLGATNRGKKQSPEHIAKRVAAIRATFAARRAANAVY